MDGYTFTCESECQTPNIVGIKRQEIVNKGYQHSITQRRNRQMEYKRQRSRVS